MTTTPPRNVEADAKELIKDAKEYSNTGSKEAAEKFAKEWRSVVASGDDYSRQVGQMAKMMATLDCNPYVPEAAALADGGILFFTALIPAFTTGARLISGSPDGEVVGSGPNGIDFVERGKEMPLPPSSSPPFAQFGDPAYDANAD